MQLRWVSNWISTPSSSAIASHWRITGIMPSTVSGITWPMIFTKQALNSFAMWRTGRSASMVFGKALIRQPSPCFSKSGLFLRAGGGDVGEGEVDRHAVVAGLGDHREGFLGAALPTVRAAQLHGPERLVDLQPRHAPPALPTARERGPRPR